MKKTRSFLTQLGLPPGDAYDLPTSPKRFPDGAHYRVEIPSVEGPRALAAVLEEAKRQNVLIHRVSQGSGIMLLTDDEIREMARLGHDAGIEVSLFVGPTSSCLYHASVACAPSSNGVGENPNSRWAFSLDTFQSWKTYTARLRG